MSLHDRRRPRGEVRLALISRSCSCTSGRRACGAEQTMLDQARPPIAARSTRRRCRCSTPCSTRRRRSSRSRDELADAYLALGVCRYETGDPAGAKREFEQALSINSDIRIDPLIVTDPDRDRCVQPDPASASRAAHPRPRWKQAQGRGPRAPARDPPVDGRRRDPPALPHVLPVRRRPVSKRRSREGRVLRRDRGRHADHERQHLGLGLPRQHVRPALDPRSARGRPARAQPAAARDRNRLRIPRPLRARRGRLVCPLQAADPHRDR